MSIFTLLMLHVTFFFISDLIIGSHIGLMSMLGSANYMVCAMDERGFFEFSDP